MDPRDVNMLLGIAGTVGSAIHKDVVELENMVIYTYEQIGKMQEVVSIMKQLRSDILREYDEEVVNAEGFILTFGDALIPLAKTTVRLEATRDSLQVTLDGIKAAERVANRFANKLPAIPKV